MSELDLVVHVGNTRRGKTLGVAHFAANMITALADVPGIRTRVLGDAGIAEEYAGQALEAVTFDDVRTTGGREALGASADVMIQIHQFLPRPLAVPVVAIVHDLHLFDVAWKYGGSPHLHKLFSGNTTDADAVVSEFPRTITELGRREPELATRSHLLPSPTLIDDYPLTDDARHWARTRFELGVPGRTTLLYPSQLQAHKNHWNLMIAVQQVIERGRDLRLVLTGSSFREHLTTGLIRRAHEIGIGDAIVFAGHVSGEELRGLYAEVDGVISPSLAEGGAYIAQEAIVHGRPVACSNLDSVVAHLSRLGVDIPLFDPFDTCEMATAIERVSDDGDVIVDGYGPALDVIAAWSWNDVAKQIAEIARGVAESRRPRHAHREAEVSGLAP